MILSESLNTIKKEKIKRDLRKFVRWFIENKLRELVLIYL